MDHLDSSRLELRHFRPEDNLRTHDMATGSDVHCGENYSMSTDGMSCVKINDSEHLCNIIT